MLQALSLGSKDHWDQSDDPYHYKSDARIHLTELANCLDENTLPTCAEAIVVHSQIKFLHRNKQNDMYLLNRPKAPSFIMSFN